MHGCYKEIAFSIFMLMLIFWAGSVHFKLLAILKANSCKTQSTVIMRWYAVDGYACGSTSSQQPLMECSFCLQSIERQKHPQCNCSLIWSQINLLSDTRETARQTYAENTFITLNTLSSTFTSLAWHLHAHTLSFAHSFHIILPSCSLFLLSHSMSCLQSYSTNNFIHWVHTHTHSHPLFLSQNEPWIDSSHTSMGRNEQSLWIGKGVK